MVWFKIFQKYFESLAKKQAVENERYKWSVEDM